MEYKKAIEIPTEAENNFRFFANMIPDIVWTALPDGYEDFHNSKFTEYTGMSEEDALGHGWHKIVHPDDLDKTLKVWKDCLKEGNPYEIEYRCKTVDGEYKWFLIRAIPWKDEEGKVIKWFGTTTDIHYGKSIREKLQKATEDLSQTNHELSRINDILNHFVYIAGHDLRSPVNNIKAIFNLLKEEPDPAKKKELLEFVEQSINRLDRTVNGILEVIGIESVEQIKKRLEFQNILEIVEADLLSPYPDIAKYIYPDFHKCPSIEFVQPYLVSIIKNMLSNAYKYRSGKRTLRIDIVTEKENEFVKIIIKDNGKGFNMESSKDIFKPFKRLTSQGEGKGVGLFLVNNIVEKNGGKIEYVSEADKGTTFTIFLKAQ